jgi:hypothetical protein
MKKLLMGSVVLFLFSASIMMFEISCKKDALADAPAVVVTATPTTVFQEGKVLSFAYNNSIGFVISNYDGSNSQNISIKLPSGLFLGYHFLTISPDHKTIFFDVVNSQQVLTVTSTYTYSCSIDGSNVKQVDQSGQLHIAF